jgi:hypothetical protein
VYNQGTMTEDTLDPELLEAVAPETTGRRLFEIRLPEHDQGSITLSRGYRNGASLVTDPRDWLDLGYEGVRFIGIGSNPTHIVPTSWDGNNVFVSRHPGTVRFENITLHSGLNTGLFFGEQNTARVMVPKFRLELVGSTVVVDPPRPGASRTKWPLFGYQLDALIQDVEIYGSEAREHNAYFHGAARHGWYWERVQHHSSGAEGIKVRSDASETAWAGPRVRLTVKDCSFADWYQTWSDRGGAAIVVQGGACDILVDGCVFWGGAARGTLPAHLRSHAVMVSSEAYSYSKHRGEIGTGVGNGHVVLRRSAITGGPGPSDWSNAELVRVARNSGEQRAAQAVLIDGCGLWGQREHVSVRDITGRYVMQGCNTPTIRDRCGAIGMDVSHEASILGGGRIIPCSEGHDTRPDVIE